MSCTAHLNIGNTWDPDLIYFVADQNAAATEDVRISMMYGNTSASPIGNAREPDRVQIATHKQARMYVDTIHDKGMAVAWTLNESCIGNVRAAESRWEKRGGAIASELEGLGIDFLIVAHPWIMLRLKAWGCYIPVEISTIMNITEPAQISCLLDMGINIKRICLPIGQNRNLKFLTTMGAFCQNLGIEAEIIVNEFCFLNKCNCEGIFRNSCYDMNAHAKPGDSSAYPRGHCIRLREKDPVNWLRAKWVLPQHMNRYQALGINHFKLTGRTHPSSFLMSIIPYYMDRSFEGELLELWPHLQTIKESNFNVMQREVLQKFTGFPASKLNEFFHTVLNVCANDCNACDYCDWYYKHRL